MFDGYTWHILRINLLKQIKLQFSKTARGLIYSLKLHNMNELDLKQLLLPAKI